MTPRLKKLLLLQPSGGWLPTGFTELEYLEHPSTTEQFVLAYFALPLPDVTSPQDSLAYETEHMFEPPTSTKESEGVIGDFYSMAIAQNLERGFYFWLDGVTNFGTNANIDQIFLFGGNPLVWNHVRFSVDSNSLVLSLNEVKEIEKALVWGASVPRKVFHLFGYPDLSDVYTRRALRGKKRSAKIWVNGQLLYDLRPVLRNSDGTAGFWDAVSKQFFENAGEGSFGYRIKTSGGSAGYSLRDPYYTAPQRPEPTVKARRTEDGVEIVPAEQPVEGEEWVYFSSTQDAELYFREETEELLTNP